MNERRWQLARTVLAMLMLALPLCAMTALPAGPSSRELVVLAGVGYGEVIEKTVSKEMMARYNTRVVVQEALNAEAYTKVLAQRNAPEISVVTADLPHFLLGQKAGLWAKLEPAMIPNMKAIQPLATAPPLGEFSVAIAANTVGIQYRTDLFMQRGFAVPVGYADLWRPEFKGRVALTSTTSGVGIRALAVLAHMRGGSERNIEPGFALARDLVQRGQVSFFATNSATFNQAMERGEIWIGIQFSEGALQFRARGAPVGFVHPQEGVSLGLGLLQVVKGAPNQEQAQQFINLILAEEFQRAITLERFAIPVRLNVSLPAAHARALPLTVEQWKTMYSHDWDTIAAKRAEWHDRWLREVERRR